MEVELGGGKLQFQCIRQLTEPIPVPKCSPKVELHQDLLSNHLCTMNPLIDDFKLSFHSCKKCIILLAQLEINMSLHFLFGDGQVCELSF